MECTRRTVLVGGLRVLLASPLFPALALGAARRRGEGGERVLVVLQLSGGNDGLNTLVPHAQDAYYRLRPTLAQPRSTLHRLDDAHGLHPSMGALAELFAEGRMCAVQRVGYPDPDRSHFRSMEIWHTADPLAPAGDTGWLGRLADQIARESPSMLAAIHVGGSERPLALRGREFLAPSVRNARSFELHPAAKRLAPERARLLECSENPSRELRFLRESAAAAQAAAARIEELAARPSPVAWPDHALAARLRLVARLICGGIGTRVFHVEHAGFDTHVRQARGHAELLGQLSTALAAFQSDLAACGVEERVLTLVFSEFGRRVQENGSRGTDHGAAAPVFLVGGGVRGGLHGAELDLERLVDGDIPFATDFRSVYATLEREWMGLEPSTSFESLPLLA